MRLSLYALPCTAVVLEGLLLWRLSKRKLWSRYPCLLLFVVYDFSCNLFLFPINRYKPEWFAGVYWRIESISLFFRLFVNLEFFRGVLGRRSTLYDISWKALLALELIVVPAILVLGWSQASSLHYEYLYLSPLIVQYFSLFQALLLLTPAAVAWYYRLPLGRNVRGLGLGFGMYLLVCTLNFASLQAVQGFFPYWQLLTPISFIAMIAVWLWAFWEYAPTPDPAPIEVEQSHQWRTEWQRLWTRTMRLLRGDIN
jgi:hypothetical protein